MSSMSSAVKSLFDVEFKKAKRKFPKPPEIKTVFTVLFVRFKKPFDLLTSPLIILSIN